MKEWFASWFDSPYYHTLYKDRDESEAQLAIDNLLKTMQLQPDARILDLACGKGRHAIHLAELGFDVTGLDISDQSIAFARQFEDERLAFFQHDMRLPFRVNYFDAVVNFFTSFGYFETEGEHLAALRNVRLNLRPGGQFVLDFFNSNWVRQGIVRHQTKTVDGIDFQLFKSVRQGHIVKKVEFQTGGQYFVFEEKVRLFELPDFEKMFEKTGLQLRQTFGDYDLSPFDSATSKRLILLAEK